MKFLLLLCLLSACSNLPTKKFLQQNAKNLNTPFEIIISNLPHKSPATALIISPDKNNFQFSASFAVSSDNYPYFLAPPSSSTAQYDAYGSFEELADEITFALEDYLKPSSISTHRNFINKHQNNITYLLIDVNHSFITSKNPDKTIGITLGTTEKNTAAALSSEWGNRQECYANISINLRIMTNQKISKIKKLSAKGERVTIDSEKSVPIAYRSAAEKIARKIILEVLNL